jgi:small-conductance mechanosensitive channel
VPGQRVRVVGGAVGAQEGVVTSVGLVYTTLATDDGPLNIPNSALLGAAIGPAAAPK